MSTRRRGRPPVDDGWVSARSAWWVFGLLVVCLLVGLALFAAMATGPGRDDKSRLAAESILRLAMFTFPVVGVLIASRQPRNPVGWILLGIGLFWSPVTDGYEGYGLVTAPGSLPRPDVVAVVTSSWWVPAIGLIGTFLLLLFPDGHLPSPRWRPFAWFTASVLVGLTVVMPLLPAPLSEVLADSGLPVSLRNAANPLGVAALEPVLRRIFLFVALVPVCIAGSALSLVVRFRRSRGQERLQLKWLVAAGAVTAAIYVTMMALSFGREVWDDPATPGWLHVLGDVSVYAFVLIPVAIGVAILRHRLYDIDQVVSRTVTYAVVVAALGGAYLVAIAALTRVLPSNSDLAVAASTLAAAAVFRPLQLRVRRVVDRRFNRARFDAALEAERFARRLRDQTDPLVLASQLEDLINRTLQPSVAHVWARPRNALPPVPTSPRTGSGSRPSRRR